MTEPVQGLVGAVTVADGQSPIFRAGRTGEMIVSELHGRYYETAYRRAMFFSYAAAQTLTTVGTVITGHIVWNGSTSVNLALQKISIGVSVTSASLTGISLASTTAGAQTSAPTSTAAITRAGSTFLGQASSGATAYTGGTILTSTSFMPLLHNTAAINTVGLDSVVIDLEGCIIVPPYTAIHLAALGAASAASAVTSSIMWEEIPI